MFKKIISYILITAHILTFGYVRDVFAFHAQSASFSLASGALTQGGGAQVAASLKLWQGSIGEAIASKSSSASFILESGYIPTIKSNPPIQTQIIPNQSWLESAAKADVFDLDDYFMSPDGAALTYSASGTTNIAVSIAPFMHSVSFSQPPAWNGTEKVKFSATDAEHNTVVGNEVTLQVEGVDNPPVLDFIPDITVNENEIVTITPHATDLDGDAVTYSFTAPLNAQGRWQTGYTDSGLYTVTATATDATSLSAAQQVRINVKNVNRPPVLNLVPDITASEGDLVTIAPIATDPDNDPITFYFSSPLDTSGKWLTGYDDSGAHIVAVRASDGIDTITQNVNVIVNNTNRAPEASLTVSKYTASPNETLNITLSGSDADSDAMVYSIKKDDYEIASGALTGTANVTASFSAIGDHTITAIVTDSGGLAITRAAGIDIVDPYLNKNAINPVIGDFNGDSLLDLGLHNSDTGLWEICISRSGVFSNAIDWLTGFGATKEWAPVGGDFNGDGLTDVGIYNSATGEFKVALSTGTGFAVQGAWLMFAGASASGQPFTGNFNADKYTDLAFYNKDTGEVKVALGNGSGFGAVSTWLNSADTGYAAMSGDFNGDGLSDTGLFKKIAGEFKIYFSNSKAFVDGGVWISGYATGRDPLLSDFNNDGLTDAGYWDNSSFAWNYAISTGSVFVNKGAWLDNYGSAIDESATTGDFNGDGITDKALFDRDAQGINRWKVQLNTLKPSDLMTEIDNGIGGKTRVVYTYASKFDNQSLPFPVYVASSISLVDTLPVGQPEEVYTQNFTYSGGYYDATDREFRGFAKIRVSDPITNNYTETYFYQGKPDQDGALKGQIDKALAFDGNNRQISQAINTYDVRKAGPADNVLGFPALTKTETTVWEEDGTFITTRSNFTYDNIGNVMEAKEDGDVAVTGDEKTAATIYAAAYGNGFNRPVEAVLKDKDLNTVSKKTFEYDTKGNLSKETFFIFNPITQETQGTQATYSYDSFGNLTLSTNALGRTVTTEYETTFYTFPQKVTNVLGHIISYVYDPKLGVVTSLTDANGHTLTTMHDSLGRVIESKNADNEVVSSYSYPDFNTKITTQLNFVKIDYADGLGRKYKSVSSGEDGAAARRLSSEVIYNARGLVEKEAIAHYIDEDPSQISCVRYEYDLRGRPKKTISDFPGTLKDAESSVSYISPLYTETIDPQGHKKGMLKDVYGNTIEVTEFTQGGVYKTNYEYDIQNNLTKVTDSQGHVTQIWYDSAGRKLKMNDPDMGVWTYEYDVLGNLIKQADAKGQILTFAYDPLNRLTGKLANGQILATYIYDDITKENCVGRLSKITDQSGSTEFFYDKLGREVKSTKTVGTTPYSVERAYDTLDRLLTLKYPDGEVVHYSYDVNSGLLEKVSNSTDTINYVNSIDYNAQGQIKTIRYGNGTSTNYTYGQDLRLSRILTRDEGRGANLQDLNYIFDKNGNITTLTDNLRSNIRTYSYDELDRLTQAQNVPSPQGGGSAGSSLSYTDFNYQYDSIGNMTYKSDVGVMTYGVAAGPHAVTTAGGYNYSYDANGNQISGKNKTFEYDAENRLAKVTTSGQVTTFVYDGDGGLVKRSAVNGSQTLSTTYIGSLYEVDSRGIMKKYIYAGSAKVCSIEVAEPPVTGRLYYYHGDHLGSSSIITDENGSQVSHYEYTPYGTIAQIEGSDNTRYKFTGKQFFEDIGLYHYGARFYDSELGRFVTADTIVQAPYDPQSLNRYTYCRNNPLNYIDPSGHFWFLAAIIGAIIGAAVGGVVAAATGGNLISGFIGGAIGGFFFGVAGSVIEGMKLQTLAAIGTHAFAGAASGVASAGILGGNAGMSAAIGGFSAGFSKFLGSTVPFLSEATGSGFGTFLRNGLVRSVAGGVVGGTIAAAFGGNFGEGARQGAMTSAVAYTANDWLHEVLQKVKNALNISSDKSELAPSDINNTSNSANSCGATKFKWYDVTSWLFSGTNYCGASKSGPGNPTSGIDYCCRKHDDCLTMSGGLWWDDNDKAVERCHKELEECWNNELKR